MRLFNKVISFDKITKQIDKINIENYNIKKTKHEISINNHELPDL